MEFLLKVLEKPRLDNKRKDHDSSAPDKLRIKYQLCFFLLSNVRCESLLNSEEYNPLTNQAINIRFNIFSELLSICCFLMVTKSIWLVNGITKVNYCILQVVTFLCYRVSQVRCNIKNRHIFASRSSNQFLKKKI